MAAIKAKENNKGVSKKSFDEIIFEKRNVNKVDLNTNRDNSYDEFPKKEFKMWAVKHPEGSDKVPGSETIVRSQHYGQAVDDFIIDWNKKKKLNRTIGYPVVQGEKI